MEIYYNRYQAFKNKSGDQMVAKVSGGYTLMTPEEYRVWRCHK